MALAPRYTRRVSPLAQWAKRLSFFSLVLLIVAGVGHRYGMVETIAFFWLLALVALLAIMALGLAVGGLYRLWYYDERAGKASLSAIFLSTLVLAPYAGGAWLTLSHPALTDISTDLDEPPVFRIAPRFRTSDMNTIRPFTAQLAEVQKAAYPEVTGRRFDASMERVLKAVQAVITANGWNSRSMMPEEVLTSEFSFEAEAPSYLLRLPADAAFRLTDEGESVFVDMRLSQRYGAHDLGSGARRIRAFMSALDAEFARQSLEIIDIPASGGTEDAVN